jgi:hypothetical protein
MGGSSRLLYRAILGLLSPESGKFLNYLNLGTWQLMAIVRCYSHPSLLSGLRTK